MSLWVKILNLFLLALSVSACGLGVRTYSAVADLTDSVWRSDQSAVFEFLPLDTLSSNAKISVILRTKAYLNLHLVRLAVKTTNPDLIYWVDTVELVMEEPGSMPLLQGEAEVRRSIRFVKNGTHRVSISPIEDQRGVVSVGVFIEGAKAKETKSLF